MSTPHIQHLEKLIQTHKRRLQVLELQAAAFGSSAPPHIVLEIDDLQEKIAALEAQLPGGVPADTSPASTEKIIILFITADPSDGTRLRLGQEQREIQEKLQLARLRERFSLQTRMALRPADLSQALLDIQPQIVHFSGHGDAFGALAFENQAGEIQPVKAAALATLFESFKDQVQCVLLNACFSEPQAHAIARHIPYVIGMNYAISDEAAIAFTIGFYQSLGAGRSIPDGFRLGCAQISPAGYPRGADAGTYWRSYHVNDQPFPPNPYVIGVPLTGPAGFFGRQDIFLFIDEILGTEQQNVVVLYGQRRVGKTSLLHQITRRLKEKDQVVAIYFDLQGHEQKMLGEVLYALARTITNTLGMPLFPADNFDDRGAFFQTTFLPAAYEKLGQRRLLLLFDEFDVLGDEMSSANSASETLFPYLNELIVNQRQIAFIFVVGRRIEELTTHFQSVFKQAAYRRIGPLKPDNARQRDHRTGARCFDL